jgi:prepilin-type N-terminal cleavage/methylation domain-containing protein
MIIRRTITAVRRTRLGFTLVEMMVVMAILLGIMLILAEAFRISLDFVRTANSTSSMILQINGAGNALQRDLSADHFFYEDGLPNGGVKLSDRRFNLAGATMPIGGYFRIVNSAPTGQVFDADNIAVNIATGHQLQFTSILPGGTDSNQFSALSPVTGGVPYSARAAEIAYFLVPTGTKTSLPGGQPLFNLVRRYRLVALTTDDLPLLNLAVAGDTTYTDVISSTNGTTANTLATVTAPANRLSLASFPAGSTRYGEDILVSNVLSFEVLAQWDGTTAANSSRPFSIGGNTDGPHDFFQGAVPTTFDTALSPAIRVRSLQITLRVYDPRMKQARQNTWKFAM